KLKSNYIMKPYRCMIQPHLNTKGKVHLILELLNRSLDLKNISEKTEETIKMIKAIEKTFIKIKEYNSDYYSPQQFSMKKVFTDEELIQLYVVCLYPKNITKPIKRKIDSNNEGLQPKKMKPKFNSLIQYFYFLEQEIENK